MPFHRLLSDRLKAELRTLSLLLWVALGVCLPSELIAQQREIRYGEKVPQDVKLIYERGLRYLAGSQLADGSWGAQQKNGVTALCIMAFLAHGEDPNFGPHSVVIRKAVRSLLQSQNASTGYIGDSMYHHGFAMLALAEAYGSVDDSSLWEGGGANRLRSIGQSLELAVRCSLTSQNNNPLGGWRYSAEAKDADTSVSGAVLMGLLAARNAGIEVPDSNIERVLEYYRSSTSDQGMVAYSGGIGGPGESANRAAVATLVFAVGKRHEWKEYKAALGHISTRLDHQEMSYPFYFRYYMAQALFQSDFDAWMKWKRENTRIIRDQQQDDGSMQGSQGPGYATAMSLLSLALDYRFLPIYER